MRPPRLRSLRRIGRALWRRRRGLIYSIGVVAFTTFLVSLTGDWTWAIGVLESLRFWIALGLLLVAVIHLTIKAWVPAIILGIAGVWCAMSTFWPLAPIAPVHSVTVQSLSLIHFNVDRDQRDVRRLAESINAMDADAIFLQEVTPNLQRELEARLTRYRIEITEARTDSRGVALLVNVDQPSPQTQIHRWQHDHTDRPIIEAVFAIGEVPTAVLSVHLKRPIESHADAVHQAEVDEATRWASDWALRSLNERKRYEVVILGDFNAVPWSTRARELSDQGGVSIPSHAAHQGTWPAGVPTRFAFPIDYVMLSVGLRLNEYDVLDDVGSDHRPIRITLDAPPVGPTTMPQTTP